MSAAEAMAKPEAEAEAKEERWDRGAQEGGCRGQLANHFRLWQRQTFGSMCSSVLGRNGQSNGNGNGSEIKSLARWSRDILCAELYSRCIQVGTGSGTGTGLGRKCANGSGSAEKPGKFHNWNVAQLLCFHFSFAKRIGGNLIQLTIKPDYISGSCIWNPFKQWLCLVIEFI